MANTPPGITNGTGTTTTNGDAAAKVKKQDTAADFKGDVKVNNNPPTKEQLEKIADLTVLDADDKPHTFKSLYADNENGKRKVLVIFIRHFFCGVRLPCSLQPTFSLPSFNLQRSEIEQEEDEEERMKTSNRNKKKDY